MRTRLVHQFAAISEKYREIFSFRPFLGVADAPFVRPFSGLQKKIPYGRNCEFQTVYQRRYFGELRIFDGNSGDG